MNIKKNITTIWHLLFHTVVVLNGTGITVLSRYFFSFILAGSGPDSGKSFVSTALQFLRFTPLSLHSIIVSSDAVEKIHLLRAGL